MIEVKNVWNPTGFHGELAISEGSDIEAVIKETVRQLAFANPAVASYQDIKFCRLAREDGTKLVYFELLR